MRDGQKDSLHCFEDTEDPVIKVELTQLSSNLTHGIEQLKQARSSNEGSVNTCISGVISHQ